jgi:PmbA protein
VEAPETQLDGLAEEVLRRASAQSDESELGVVRGERALTRFARSTIHQNVVEQTLELSLRVVRGARIATVTTSRTDGEALDDLVERAVRIADATPPADDWPGVGEPTADTIRDAVSEATVACGPAERARLVGIACADLPAETLAFGGVMTSASEHLVANSRGLFRTQRRTAAEMRVTVRGRDRSGAAVRVSPDVRELDAAELTREALAAVRLPGDEVTLPPGDYPAVLSPPVVGRMLELLSFVGFAASRHAEGRSFVRLGEPLTAPSISICDDGHDPAGLPVGFDVEGTPKQRVELVRDGVAAGLLYDRRSARRAGVGSTGHAVPPDVGDDPHAANLFMAAGDRSFDELVGELARGIWIRHVHYVNILDPAGATITGVTRDGPCLVEHGVPATRVREMRFRVGLVELLRTAEAVSRERRLLPQIRPGSVCVPGLRVPAFRFEAPAGA